MLTEKTKQKASRISIKRHWRHYSPKVSEDKLQWGSLNCRAAEVIPGWELLADNLAEQEQEQKELGQEDVEGQVEEQAAEGQHARQTADPAAAVSIGNRLDDEVVLPAAQEKLPGDHHQPAADRKPPAAANPAAANPAARKPPAAAPPAAAASAADQPADRKPPAEEHPADQNQLVDDYLADWSTDPASAAAGCPWLAIAWSDRGATNR